MSANEAHDAPSAAGGPSTWTLAERINHLFDTIRRPDGSRHSNEEVAAAMRNDQSRAGAKGLPQISAQYLWLLRRGDRDNPTKRHLEALARFFDVSPAYFFDDEQSQAIASELALLKALREAGVQRLAARLTGLSPRTIDAITQIVESARAVEGLPGPEPSAE
jgi:transcriptional regulator with XRE-family HTH domain